MRVRTLRAGNRESVCVCANTNVLDMKRVHVFYCITVSVCVRRMQGHNSCVLSRQAAISLRESRDVILEGE